MDLCHQCSCVATVETIWGDDLCQWHYDNGPTTERCPACSQDVTPVGLPVADQSDRPGDATDAGAPPPASVAPISPVVETLPPESTTGDPFTLADMVQALEWCVTRAEDHGAPVSISAAADRGLTLLRHLERGYTKAVEA